MASSSPSPFDADVLNIWNVLFLRASRPNALCTSAGVRQPAMSCNNTNCNCGGYFSSNLKKVLLISRQDQTWDFSTAIAVGKIELGCGAVAKFQKSPKSALVIV